MLRLARHTVYWPGMEGDLQHYRSICVNCDIHTPSLPPDTMITASPSSTVPLPVNSGGPLPAQSHMYMAYAARLKQWLEDAYFPSGTSSNRRITKLCGYFTNGGAPEQLSTDSRTNLASKEMLAFLKKWGSQYAYLQSTILNQMAGWKMLPSWPKRMLCTRTGANGSLDMDKTSQALLQYFNTPLRDMQRQLQDSVPTVKQNYKTDRHWHCALCSKDCRWPSLMTDHPSL